MINRHFFMMLRSAGFLCINKLDVAFLATYCNGLVDTIVMCSEGLVYEGGNSHERSNILLHR